MNTTATATPADTMTYTRDLGGSETPEYDAVKRWHSDVHTGRLEHCHEQPCHAVARAAGHAG